MKSLFNQFLLHCGLVVLLSACNLSDSVLEKGERLEAENDYPGAYRVYSEGLKDNPNNQAYLWKQAISGLWIGKIDQALSYCEIQLKKNPFDSKARLLKARCYEYLGYQNSPKQLYQLALNSGLEGNSLEEKRLKVAVFSSLNRQKDVDLIARDILRVYNSPERPRDFELKSSALCNFNRQNEAREILQNGLEKFPENVVLHLNLAGLYGKQEDYKKSIEHAKFALNEGWNQIWVWNTLANAYYFDGKYKEALEFLNKSIEKHPNDLSSRCLRMKTYAHLKQLDKAEAEMQAILKFDPDNAYAITAMSTAYSIAGDKKGAKEILVKNLDSMPDEIVLKEELADINIYEKNYSEAARILNEIIFKDKNNANAHFYRAVICGTQNSDEVALNEINLAIKNDATQGRFYLEKISILEKLQKNKEILESAQIFSNFCPWKSVTSTALTKGYLYNGKYDLAVKSATEGINRHPDVKTLLLERSIAYGMLGEEDREKADFDKFITLSLETTSKDASSEAESRASFYYSRGIFYKELGRYEKAIESLTTAIELNPKDEQNWCARGCSHYKNGDYQKAISDCNNSLALNSCRVHPYLTRGSAYREIGDFEKSLNDLDKAAEMSPGWGEVFYERSQLYKKLYKTDLAKADLRL